MFQNWKCRNSRFQQYFCYTIRAALAMLTRVMCLYFTTDNHPSISPIPSFFLSDIPSLHHSSPYLFSHLENLGQKRTCPYWKHLQTSNQKYCTLKNDNCDLWCGRKHCKMGKLFSTTILTFFYNVFEKLPFLDRQKSACLVLKLTREVSISPLVILNVFNHYSLLPLQSFQKPYLSGSWKLRIVWYSNLMRGIDFLLSKKCFTLPSFSPSCTMF